MDPYLETLVTHAVGSVGGDIFLQVLASSFVEGGRETLLGPLSQFMFRQTQDNVITQHELRYVYMTDQDTILNNMELREEQVQVKTSWSSVIKAGSLAMFATALSAIGGPVFLGASMVAGISAVRSLHVDTKIFRRIIDNIVFQRLPSDYYESQVIADSIRTFEADAILDAISEAKVSSLPHTRIHCLVNLKERISAFIQGHKIEAGVISVVPILGLLSPILLVGGAIITGLSLFMKKVISSIRLSRRSSLSDHHPERRFILRIIDAFFDISSLKYRGALKLPGYEGKFGGIGQDYAESALRKLGRIITTAGGEFYSIGERLFEQIWWEGRKIFQKTLNKLEHLLLFSSQIPNVVKQRSLDAIKQYRIEKGYFYRELSPNNAEWDFVRALQRAYSDQGGKFLGFRDLANKLRVVNDGYFTGKLYSSFIKKISDGIVDKIETKVEYDHQNGDLEYNNYLICRRAIDNYRDHKQGRSISFNPPSTPKSEIIEILRDAYTEHPILNPTPGQRIDIDILCNEILGKIYHAIDSMNDKNPFSDKEIKFIFKKVREDRIDTFAAEKYNQLYEKLCQHNPLSMLRYSSENWAQYYESIEPRMEAWLNKMPLQNIIDSSKDFNKYFPYFIKTNTIRTQREILYALWGGRDLMTGELFKDIVNDRRKQQGLPELTGDALYEEALKEIQRHHYKILWIKGSHIEFMKRDCGLEALVPLSKSSHAAIRGAPRRWELNFRRANEAIFNGKPYIPDWWRSQYQRGYENYLRKQGWMV